PSGMHTTSTRRRTTQDMPVQEASLSSLPDVADAMRAEPDPSSTSGVRPMPAAGRSLGDLVNDSFARRAIAAVEVDIDRRDWPSAVRHAVAAYRQLARTLAGSSTGHVGEAGALAALVAGLPASWYQRFLEIERRITGSGTVTSEDGMFLLFFLAAAALRS